MFGVEDEPFDAAVCGDLGHHAEVLCDDPPARLVEPVETGGRPGGGEGYREEVVGKRSPSRGPEVSNGLAKFPDEEGSPTHH